MTWIRPFESDDLIGILIFQNSKILNFTEQDERAYSEVGMYNLHNLYKIWKFSMKISWTKITVIYMAHLQKIAFEAVIE